MEFAMKMQRLVPNMMVEDVEKTIVFYHDVLGFQTVISVPDEGPAIWAFIQNGEAKIMLQARSSFEKEQSSIRGQKIGASITFHINVSEVKPLYESVKDKVRIVEELHKTWYGDTTFTMTDCNGYLLTFAQREQCE